MHSDAADSTKVDHPSEGSTHSSATCVSWARGRRLLLCLSSDAPGYAQDFLTIFKAIGWKVNEEATSESLSDEFTGLAFVATGPDSLPPVAEALRDVLRIYEIEVGTLYDPTCNMRSSGFILSVGPPASSNFDR